MNETVDVNFKPLSEKSFNLVKELLETRVSCVTVLSNLMDVEDIKFSDLHHLLCGRLESAYLLKALLAINMPYRQFVMTKTDLSLLICPVLKKVYEASVEDVNVLDEAFNILQILSRDETFNIAIHSTKFDQVNW